jgi:hypothetical protein
VRDSALALPDPYTQGKARHSARGRSRLWPIPLTALPQGKARHGTAPAGSAASRTSSERDRRSGGHFYMVTNADGARNLKVVRTAAAGDGAWEEVVPHRQEAVIEEMEVSRAAWPCALDPLAAASEAGMHVRHFASHEAAAARSLFIAHPCRAIARPDRSPHPPASSSLRPAVGVACSGLRRAPRPLRALLRAASRAGLHLRRHRVCGWETRRRCRRRHRFGRLAASGHAYGASDDPPAAVGGGNLARGQRGLRRHQRLPPPRPRCLAEHPSSHL